MSRSMTKQPRLTKTCHDLASLEVHFALSLQTIRPFAFELNIILFTTLLIVCNTSYDLINHFNLLGSLTSYANH
jgi:hypothetical protein